MEQLDKVRKGLECCVLRDPDDHLRCGECPYNPHAISNEPCANGLKFNALALIRQQQERIAELEAAQTARLITEKDFEKADGWGNIPAWYEHNPSFKIKTIDGWGIISPKKLRDRMTRYWTQRPTEAERRTMKWE